MTQKPLNRTLNHLDWPSVGDRIRLTEPEVRLVKFLAQARYLAARKNGVPDGKIGPQSCEMTDAEGLAGEVACAKLFNVYPDLQLSVRPPYDLLIAGLRIDVKMTKYANGRLLATKGKKDKRLPIDAFILMTGDWEREIVYRGCMPAALLLRDDRLRDLGHGKGYAIDQSELLEFDALLNRSDDYNEDGRETEADSTLCHS